MTWKKLASGSVKDLWVHGQSLRMKFSDRISVFDWGPLPYEIPGRGVSLARFAEAIVGGFEGDPAFCLFRVPGRDRDQAPDVIECEWVRHPKLPDSTSSWTFVPLEVVFRLRLAEGSSLLKREPQRQVGEFFEAPRVEFTTKLESVDRLLSLAEAAAMTACPVDLLTRETQRIARKLQTFFSERGLDLWDGKLEWAYRQENGQFEVALVDAITPDELRLTIKGQPRRPLSKELLRQWLSSTPWAHELRLAKTENPVGFRDQVRIPVPRLGRWRGEILSQLYQMLADTVVLRDLGVIQKFLSFEASLKPRVAILGQGARESALAWRLEQENCEAYVVNPKELSFGLEEFREADAVVVSRDQELADGFVDRLSREGFFTFGPPSESAQIESSKKIGREIADEAGLPGPHWSVRVDEVRSWPQPPVIKKIGLAAGKGVFVPGTWKEFEDRCLQWSGEELLFEERLSGIEASVFYFLEVSGSSVSFRYLGAAKDFKRRFPGDVGPNTGGMGAQVPHPEFDSKDRLLCDDWIQRLGMSLVERKWHYYGIVFLGLMKDQKSWKLLEFNARFGDPETEALVMSWAEGRVLRSLLRLDLSPPEEPEVSQSSVALVLVHPDYPDAPRTPLLPLASWEPEGVCLFRTPSLIGRVAVLAAAAPSLTEAGDKIFGVWTESPWKDSLDWRPDVLP